MNTPQHNLNMAIEFTTGYDPGLEPRPVLLIFKGKVARKFTLTTNWTVEEAATMASGLLKYVEIAHRQRAERAKGLKLALTEIGNWPDGGLGK